MPIENLVGYLGGSCVLVCRLPQLFKILKTKKVRDISLAMYFLAMLGGFFWIFYGILLKDPVIVISNILVSALDLTILVCKIGWTD